MKLWRNKYSKIQDATELESKFIKVLAAPVIATVGTLNGKLLPLLILDASERPDIVELVRVHKNFPEGDVVVQWGAPEGRPDYVVLILRFLRPTEVIAMIEFSIFDMGVVVDQILMAGAVYLQPGKVLENFKPDILAPKVIVEIPETGFREEWNKLYPKVIVNGLKRQGMKNALAKKSAFQMIEAMRNFGRKRMV